MGFISYKLLDISEYKQLAFSPEFVCHIIILHQLIQIYCFLTRKAVNTEIEARDEGHLDLHLCSHGESFLVVPLRDFVLHVCTQCLKTV